MRVEESAHHLDRRMIRGYQRLFLFSLEYGSQIRYGIVWYGIQHELASWTNGCEIERKRSSAMLDIIVRTNLTAFVRPLGMTFPPARNHR